MAFSPPVLGHLVKKGLQKEGSRAPPDPPGFALAHSGVNLIFQTFLGVSLGVQKTARIMH